MNKKCAGCGAVLQTQEKEKQGFIIKEKYASASYCERCFKIIHYNEKHMLPLKGINEYILKKVNKSKTFVFFLIDFLNINKETIETFKKINNNKILVISKLDIIPKSIKTANITSWLKKEYKIKEEILFFSTKKNINIAPIVNRLEKEKTAYILGYTNAGKSSLINKLCADFHLKANPITTSLLPNTTLDFISLKLKEDLVIIDSPGFTLKESIVEEKEFDLLEKINPKSFLKPTTYQVKPISSILIEDKIRIQSSVANSFTFYMSSALSLKRVFDKNKKNKENKKFIYNISDNQDVVMKGIGFLNIKKACQLTIYIKDENIIEIRNAMF